MKLDIILTLALSVVCANVASAGLKIYYIRHAEGGHNVKKDWEKRKIPKEEWPSYVGDANVFTPLGLEQQSSVSQKLKQYGGFDFIASSPMWRCRNTIISYMEEVGAKGEIWAELSEQPANARILEKGLPEPLVPIIGAGAKVGLPDEELEYFSVCEEAPNRFIINRADTGPGAADRSAAAARMVIQNVLDRVQDRFGGTDASILFAGHGSSGKAVLRMFTQDTLTELPGISNTGVWMVEEQENGEFRLMMFNDEAYPVKNQVSESKNRLRAKFIPADKNKDEQLTKAEYVEYSTANFDQKDSDGDGVLSITEHDHASFKKADISKDGLLTRKEYASIFVGHFENSYDKNGDGVVTVSESNASN